MPSFYFLAFLPAVLIIVFIHELGHFLVGRWCGVKAEVFAVGFGREIFGFTDRHGTRWKFCWLPLGGYVRFEGDANVASLPTAGDNHSATSLPGAALWRRALIVAAGPFANFLLSILVFAGFFGLTSIPISEPRIDEVLVGSAAEQAGLKKGDYIRFVEGTEVKTFSDIQQAMTLRDAIPLKLIVERGAEKLNLTLTPKATEIDDGRGGKVRVMQLGVRHDPKLNPPGTQHYTPLQAIKKGVDQTIFVASTTLQYISKVIMGTESAKQLHGPIGVAVVAGDFAELGFWPFVFFIGLISVSIGLVNLFPIPMLDGGHLLFYLIEAVIGRPVSPQAQEWSFRIGLSAILMLMVLVTFNNDLQLLTGS